MAPAPNNNKPTLSATASDNTGGSGLATVQFEYSSDGGTSWTNAGAAETSGPFSFTFTTALADGTYRGPCHRHRQRGQQCDLVSRFLHDRPRCRPRHTPTPPSVMKAQLLDVTVITGHGKHQKKTTKFAGFELIFNEALNSASAQNASNYQVLQTTKKGQEDRQQAGRLYGVVQRCR